MTGIVEYLNQTPMDWFSKRQNQVKTATYGSECDAGPGLNGSRVGNESRDGDVVTSMDGGSANANASESAAPAVLPILWNNQYAVLADTDEAT